MKFSICVTILALAVSALANPAYWVRTSPPDCYYKPVTDSLVLLQTCNVAGNYCYIDGSAHLPCNSNAKCLTDGNG